MLYARVGMFKWEGMFNWEGGRWGGIPVGRDISTSGLCGGVLPLLGSGGAWRGVWCVGVMKSGQKGPSMVIEFLGFIEGRDGADWGDGEGFGEGSL